MIYNVILDDSYRICAISKDFDLREDQIKFDFPDDFEVSEAREYKIIDSKLIREDSMESRSLQAADAMDNLQKTDYVALKLSERLASGKSCDDLMVKYADILKRREEWRAVVDEYLDGVRDIE